MIYPRRVYKSASEEIKGLDPILRCDACGAEMTPGAGDMGGYLRDGWPKCCTHTMRLVTAKERALEGVDDAG